MLSYMIKRTLLLLAAFAIVGCAACMPTNPTDGRVTAVVGDSITYMASAQIKAGLGVKNVTIHSTPGIDLVDGRKNLVSAALKKNPEIVVVELGVNSAREVWDSTDSTAVEAILKDLKSVPCVVWVTPTALAPSYYDHLGTGTLRARLGKMKATIVRLAAAYPNATVVDFGAVQDKNPGYFDDDHLHMVAKGHDALALFIAQSVEVNC